MADTEDTETTEALVVLAAAACVCGGVAACFTCQTADAASAGLLARDERIRADEREKLARVFDMLANEWEATALGPMGIGVDRGRFKAFRSAAQIAREALAGEVEAR